MQALLVLMTVVGGWSATQPQGPDARPTCSNGLDWEACRCDVPCSQYGDCCLDAPWFVPEQQKLGVSLFSCESFDKTDVYMMSSCPQEWEDPYTRFHCEHPDTSYRDPLFDVPVTSYRTNITYRNRHCAFCHHDLDAGSANFWSVYFFCENEWLNLDNETIINYLIYNTTTLTWSLNITKNTEFQIFEDGGPSKYLYSCRVWVDAHEALRAVLRPCNSSTVDKCPEDWTDEGVRAQCQAYTARICLNGTVYRNYYCGVCNNNGSFDGSVCTDQLSPRLKPTVLPPAEFTVVLDWRRLRKRNICQQETEGYDPLTRTCRTVFQYTAPDNNTSSSVAEMSGSSLGSCQKIQLEAAEYEIEDSDTMTVFVPAYNTTFQLHEYRIGNDSRLTICLPRFIIEDVYVHHLVQGLGYVTAVGVSLSIIFLLLHLFVFVMTPRLRNLSSMNLASLSVSLLIMYCAFAGASLLRQTGIPCVVVAVIIHYGLLASFCWMLVIAYDINRILRQATAKLIVSKGRHWQRFGLYCLLSWVVPAVIVGVALTAEFSTDKVTEHLRPGYGVTECWFSSAIALLIFIVGPLLVVMILNAALFFWSAYLIHTTTSEMRNKSSSHTDVRLYGRLALIMGLTWAVGLVAGYVDVLVVWYAFVLLNTLQGLFIFLAFTCSRKVLQELQTRAFISSPDTTYT